MRISIAKTIKKACLLVASLGISTSVIYAGGHAAKNFWSPRKNLFTDDSQWWDGIEPRSEYVAKHDCRYLHVLKDPKWPSQRNQFWLSRAGYHERDGFQYDVCCRQLWGFRSEWGYLHFQLPWKWSCWQLDYHWRYWKVRGNERFRRIHHRNSTWECRCHWFVQRQVYVQVTTPSPYWRFSVPSGWSSQTFVRFLRDCTIPQNPPKFCFCKNDNLTKIHQPAKAVNQSDAPILIAWKTKKLNSLSCYLQLGFAILAKATYKKHEA